MRSSMWSTMPTPWRAADLRAALQQLDQPEPLAVERDRPPGLEADPQQLRLVGRLLGPGDELEDVVGGGLAPGPRSRRPSEERPQRLSSIE